MQGVIFPNSDIDDWPFQCEVQGDSLHRKAYPHRNSRWERTMQSTFCNSNATMSALYETQSEKQNKKN